MAIKVFSFGGHTYIGDLKEEKEDCYIATGVIQLLPTPDGKMAGIGFGFDMGNFNGEVVFPKGSTAVADPKVEAIKIYENVSTKIRTSALISGNLTYGGKIKY